MERLIVQRPGGMLTVDGRDDFPESESIRVGEDVILFLFRYEADSGKYRITRNAFGAFRVTGGNVVALTTTATTRRGDRPKKVQIFEREMTQFLSR